MNYLNFHAASDARRLGQDWTIRIEYVGRNGENVSGYSSKFWQAGGVGRGMVEVRWGKIGGSSQTLVKDWSYVVGKLPKKLNEGYRYVSGTSSNATQPAYKAAQVARPAPAPQAPADLAAGILGAVATITADHARCAGLPSAPVAPHLPGPFGLVAGLRAVKAGFEALDANGKKLMLLTFDGGRQLSQEHNVPVLGL